ncbi:MAG: YhbD family protein [Candidatus Bipolaricaulota bacterium]|nr:YhbD family protein [Candidatus Bipolaricaulota bacterium]
MDTDDTMIPKKEVLHATGISYGQLYRWKRLGLIPEAWFVRRSTFTGQETFFPRDKILKRIEDILRLKDDHPLEELVRLLAPEAVPAAVGHPDPLALPPIGKEGKGLLWKEGEHTFPELVALACGAEAVRRGALPAEGRLVVELVRALPDALRAPTGLAVVLAEKGIEREGIAFRAPVAVLAREPLALDGECRVKVKLDLERVVEEVQLALGGGERG